MAKIRILLADDHTLFRQGIKGLLAAEPDMEVVGEASNGGDSIDKAGSDDLEPHPKARSYRHHEISFARGHRDDNLTHAFLDWHRAC